MDRPPDKEFLVTISLLGLFGGMARLLREWDPKSSYLRGIGSLLTSLLAGHLVGFLGWEYTPDRPAMVWFTVALASWAGADLIEGRLLRSILETILTSIPGKIR